jgi:hypothetical protein
MDEVVVAEVRGVGFTATNILPGTSFRSSLLLLGSSFREHFLGMILRWNREHLAGQLTLLVG